MSIPLTIDNTHQSKSSDIYDHYFRLVSGMFGKSAQLTFLFLTL